MKTLKAMCLLLVLPALLMVAACGDNNAVGSQALTHFTPAPSPRPSPSPVATHKTTASAAPTVRKSTPPPTAATVIVLIQSDASSTPLKQQNIIVKAGTIVKWVNRDSVPRGVTATGGAFKSPSIPPGGSWSYTFTVAGTYDYQDSTRPYVTGQVAVR